MKSFLLAVIAALFFPITASAVQLITFYAECNLGLIDTFGDRISTPIGSLGEWNVEAMDYGPDGLLYATVQHGCWTHGSADTLAIIDPVALFVVPIGDVDALAFDPNGELFGVSMASYELITIDPITGAGTPVGPLIGLPGSFLGAIEFTPDGKLRGIDMLTADVGPSSLWEINRDTGAASLIGGLGFDSVEGMTLNTGGLIAVAVLSTQDMDATTVRTRVECGAESAELRSSNEVGLSIKGSDGVRTLACR